MNALVFKISSLLCLFLLLISNANTNPARFEGNTLYIDCAQISGLLDHRLELTHIDGTTYDFNLSFAAEVSGIAPLACAAEYVEATSELNVTRVKVGADQYDLTLRLTETSPAYRFELTGAVQEDINPDNFSFVETEWSYVSPTSWDDSAYMIFDVPVMDVNNDGLPDIVIGGPIWRDSFVEQTVPLLWMENRGDGTFEPGDNTVFPDSAALSQNRHMKVADFNNDGNDDLAIVGFGFDGEPYPGERNPLLLSAPGNTFQDISVGNSAFDYPGNSHGMDIGDVNGDGETDIVAVDVNVFGAPEANLVRVLINDGDGNFQRDLSAIQYNDRTGFLDVALEDLNGDGAAEIIFGAVNDTSEVKISDTQIFWNDGTGHYDPDNYTTIPAFEVNGEILWDTLAVTSLDLNFDGIQDLILSRSASYTNRGIQFLINNNDRTFTDVSSTYSPWLNGTGENGNQLAYFLNIVDFNGDGLEDLLLGYDTVDADDTSSEDDNTNSFLWLRNSDGTFSGYSSSNFGFRGVMWPIDFDLDGDVDLVSRCSSSFTCYNANPQWRIFENKLID